MVDKLMPHAAADAAKASACSTAYAILCLLVMHAYLGGFQMVLESHYWLLQLVVHVGSLHEYAMHLLRADVVLMRHIKSLHNNTYTLLLQRDVNSWVH